MAETTTAETPTMQLPEPRRMVGIEASWEIDALMDCVRSLTADLGHGEQAQSELLQLRWQLRGLTARIGQLNGVVMSVLGDDDETQNLERLVHGDVLATARAIHG